MASPAKYFSVFLPCKAYIRKYVGVQHGYPFQADNRTSLGCFINATLMKDRFTDRSKCFTESFIDKYFTAKFEVRVSQFTFVNIGWDFPVEKVREINWFLEARFDEHLHEWVEARYIDRWKTKRFDLIRQFAESHGIIIDEDITLDALVKSEYRLRFDKEARMEKAKEQLPKSLFN